MDGSVSVSPLKIAVGAMPDTQRHLTEQEIIDAALGRNSLLE